MNIKVEYTAQLRAASDTTEESYEFESETSFGQLLRAIQDRHGEPLVAMLMDDESQLHRWILADRSGSLVRESQTALEDGDTIRLMSPISGG